MHLYAEDIECADSLLHEIAPGTRRLSEHLLKDYSGRSVLAGWRLPIKFSNGELRRIDLLLRKGGARRIPLVALVDRPDFLTWPHIEKDGVVCLKNNNPAYEIGNLTNLIQHQISAAVILVSECESNQRQQDFRDEASSYWSQKSNSDTKVIHSLIDAFGPSRLINVWHGKNQIVCADDKSHIVDWLDNKTGKSERWKTRKEVYLWLDASLLPSEFPETAQDVYELIEKYAPALVEDFCNIVRDANGAAAVLIGAPTKTGTFLGAVLLPRPTSRGKGKDRGNHVPGFRAGREPPTIVKNHYLGMRKVMLSTVQRTDARWVHGRDHNDELKELDKCTVAIIGCGSVGGHLAEYLAQAGVPRFHLVDGELLAPENTSRHPLGAEHVNLNKASSLASHLKSRLPHIAGIHAYNKRWEQLSDDELDIISEADLVISATGDIGSELSLCAELREKPNPPHMLFTWLGGHALTGYSLAIGPDGPCLRCILDKVATPKISAIEFDGETTMKTEPACSNMFQPYGIVELVSAVSEMADLSLSLLLGKRSAPILRIQVQTEERVLVAGGKWTNTWLETTGRSDGGFSWEGEIEVDPDCPEQH